MIADIKRRALHRTKILQGQLKGIEKMIESEEYCVDIVTQTLAIQKSIGSLNKLVIENHLRTHIPEKFSSGDASKQAAAIDELLAVYELTNNRSNGK